MVLMFDHEIVLTVLIDYDQAMLRKGNSEKCLQCSYTVAYLAISKPALILPAWIPTAMNRMTWNCLAKDAGYLLKWPTNAVFVE